MKTRNGFVSNSSSSSFVLLKEHLTPYQVHAIVNHQAVYYTFSDEDKNKIYGGDVIDESDVWSVRESDTALHLSVWMDNFSMNRYLDHLGVQQVAYADKYHSEDYVDDSDD
jgi:hypothetical protein